MALVVSLPRIVRREMDTEKVTKLRLTSAYARFLGRSGVSVLLASSQSTLCEALLQTLALDRGVTGENLIESRFARGLHISMAQIGGGLAEEIAKQPGPLSVSVPFAHCHIGAVADAALALPVELGRVAGLDALEYFAERAESEGHETHAESFLVCRQFYLGYAESGDAASVTRLAVRLIELALHPPSTCDALGLALCCELLRTLVVSKRVDFAPFVAGSVPLLIKLLGSPNLRLSHMAWSCLEAVAVVEAHCSVHELIRANADYVVDGVVRDLRASRSLSPHAIVSTATDPVPLSVSGLLKHSPTNVSWLLDDVLTEVLACLDGSAKSASDLLLYSRILRDLSAAVPATSCPLDDESEAGSGEEGGGHDNGNDDDINGGGKAESMRGTEEPHRTREQWIALRILDRVRHFISFPALVVQTHSLDAVCHCLNILRNNRKELLPAIYSVWDSLMLRLESKSWSSSDDSNIVVARVADAMGIIAELGTDFLAGEKFERAWRSYRSILAQHQPTPLSITQDAQLFLSSNRLQHAMLQSLLQLVQFVPISNVAARSVVETLLPLLHDDTLRLPFKCLCALAAQSNAHRVYLWFAARRAARSDLVQFAIGLSEKE
jgi:hypothetical protein